MSTLGRQREHKKQDCKSDVNQSKTQVKCCFKGKKKYVFFSPEKKAVITIMTKYQEFLTIRKLEYSTDTPEMP